MGERKKCSLRRQDIELSKGLQRERGPLCLEDKGRLFGGESIIVDIHQQNAHHVLAIGW